jgi:hypothetical protein
VNVNYEVFALLIVAWVLIAAGITWFFSALPQRHKH